MKPKTYFEGAHENIKILTSIANKKELANKKREERKEKAQAKANNIRDVLSLPKINKIEKKRI